ncbi:hypothetical protein EB233_10820 [Mesorhizobium erdmanii]|uniref:Uncharacterized protein n=1 Tax=Mesorhizobium erdmanii TaxID=1777866 RepID=A0A6M7UIJ4_9HYPH|nr:hypothetical protein A8146_23795 [Mesorhizobium loti]QKC75968.1 hypothetical protein EB233_10820 [Mesorhizobium erdmanii]
MIGIEILIQCLSAETSPGFDHLQMVQVETAISLLERKVRRVPKSMQILCVVVYRIVCAEKAMLHFVTPQAVNPVIR